MTVAHPSVDQDFVGEDCVFISTQSLLRIREVKTCDNVVGVSESLIEDLLFSRDVRGRARVRGESGIIELQSRLVLDDLCLLSLDLFSVLIFLILERVTLTIIVSESGFKRYDRL